MAQTTSRDIIIGALVFTALITGIFTMVSYSVPSGTDDFDSYNRTFNKFNEIKTQTDEVVQATEGAEPDEGAEGILSGLYSSSFGALRNAWDVLDVLDDFINDLNEGGLPFNIPGWFVLLISGIIFTTLTFALISSWRKWYT